MYWINICQNLLCWTSFMWCPNCFHLTREVKPLSIFPWFQQLSNDQIVQVEMHVLCYTRRNYRLSGMSPSKAIRTPYQTFSNVLYIFRGPLQLVAPLFISHSLVYVLYEVHLSNMKLCYGWKQPDFGECWSSAEPQAKLLWQTHYFSHCSRRQRHIIISSTAPWLHLKINKMLRDHGSNWTCRTYITQTLVSGSSSQSSKGIREIQTFP